MPASARAKTTNVDACEPLVTHCLAPVMRPPAARVRMRAGVRARARPP